MVHFILKWSSQMFKEDPFPYNMEIIKGNGMCGKFSKNYVFWGKWHRERPTVGKSRLLEPVLQEPYDPRKGKETCDLANMAIEDGNPVYLYLYNDFFVHPLVIANVVEAFYTAEELPPRDEDKRPACAHMPFYYLHHKREQECLNCRDEIPRCKMRFTCNFWFKVNDFCSISRDQVQKEFDNLVYGDWQVAEQGARFDPFGAAYYPILVELSERRDFFEHQSDLEHLESLPRITCSEKFKKQVARLESNRRKEMVRRIKDLSSCLVENTDTPSSLRFHKLEGNPVPGSTHECYAHSDQDAKRIFGHFVGGSYILDEIGTHL